MTFLSKIQVARFAGDKGEWTLTAPLIYQGNQDRFIVPKGFKTDFASIPRIFFVLFPKNGNYDAAAIVHDWLYVTQPMVHGPKWTRSRMPITRRDADGIFRRIMKELGVRCVRRNLMYLAVRIGGWYGWANV